MNSLLFKIPTIIYRWFIFPFAAGFLVILQLSSLVHNLRLNESNKSHFSLESNSLMHLFTLIVLAITFGIEFYGKTFV